MHSNAQCRLLLDQFRLSVCDKSEHCENGER